MAYKLCICSNKGGVGKTTSALNIANGLNCAGKKSLLIDLDYQKNATSTYRAQSDGVATIVDVLKGDVHAMEAIQHMPMGDIIAGDQLLTQEKTFFMNRPGRENLLKKRMAELDKEYDFIIMDTHPDSEIYTTVALTAADAAVIPVVPDTYSIDGLVTMVNFIEELREAVNPNLKLLGVFLNRYSGKNSKEKRIKQNFHEELDAVGLHPFNVIVRDSAAIGNALDFDDEVKEDGTVELADRSVFTHFPKSNAAVDFAELIVEIIEEANK